MILRRTIFFSRWSCNGLLTSPICIKETSCFRLKFGGKISYFDCHRCFLPLDHKFRLDSDTFKKGNIVLEGPPRRLSGPEITDMLDNLVLNKEGNGFVGYGNDHNWTHKCTLWELLYAKALILMHKIDVMHQERNIGESILSTCMSFADKTKDNHKARKDLALLCNRPSLELKSHGGKPRAPFCLKARDRKEVLIWLKKLKFPDGYVVGFRRVINLDTGKLSRVKSHDYHIFMERRIPVMFRGYLDDDVWTALAELSHFHRQLCAKEIRKNMMEKLEEEISVLLCKLEKIFPPGWFNPMQHLLVHLPYEAKIGGPQQYRWMYHIERALEMLRSMVHNMAKVEGCIAEEFKLKEIAYFNSVYFAAHHNVNAPILRYHVDEDIPHSDLQIFQWTGVTVGASTAYQPTEEEQMLLCSKCMQIWMRWINI
jgi:hypothetical protein